MADSSECTVCNGAGWITASIGAVHGLAVVVPAAPVVVIERAVGRSGMVSRAADIEHHRTVAWVQCGDCAGYGWVGDSVRYTMRPKAAPGRARELVTA